MSDQKKRPVAKMYVREKGAERGKGFTTLFVAWEGKFGNMWALDSRITDEQLLEIVRDLRKPHTERKYNLGITQDTQKGQRHETATISDADSPF